MCRITTVQQLRDPGSVQMHLIAHEEHETNLGPTLLTGFMQYFRQLHF